MSNENTAMLTGRIVFVIGDLFAGDSAKIYGTQTPKMNKAGQPYREYGFGLAVPKTAWQDPRWDATDFWNKMHQFVASKYNGQLPANFKWKWIDGDTGVTQEGVKVNTKQGYPGHYVFTFKTTITPKFFRGEGPANARVYTQIADGIKCGDWVRVQTSFDINLGANCSLYLNPQAIEFVGYGDAIVNAPTGAQIFGAGPSFVPPGASATPLASSAPMPAQPPQQVWGQAPVQTQAPAPHYGIVPSAHQPAPMPAQPPQQVWGQAPGPNGPAAPVMPAPGPMNPGHQIQNFAPAGPGPTAPQPAYPSNGMPMPPGPR